MKYTTATALAMAAGATADSVAWEQWSATADPATSTSTSSWDPWTSSSTTTTQTWESWKSSTTKDPASSSTWESWASSSTKDPASTATWETWAASSSSTKDPVKSSSTAWESWKECPATVTVVKTATETAYQATKEIYDATVTIPVPSKPATVDIKPVWAEWTSSSSSTGKPVYTVPAGCTAKNTATTTTTVTSTVTGTTTVHKSTLFLGVAGAAATGGAANGGWNGNGNNNGGNGAGNGNGNGNNNGGAWGNGNGNGNGNNNNGGAWGNGNGAGNGGWNGNGPIGGDGFNGDVMTFSTKAPSQTHQGAAPTYTQGPNGQWGGAPWGGRPIGDNGEKGWGGWNGTDGNGSNGGNGGKGNGTAPVDCAYGAPCSNVTKPFEPLADSSCNSAGGRSKWCGGKDTSSNYYENYFSGETKHFDFVITNGTANFDGEDVLSFLINGQSPGPLIEANWGDMVSVTVHNQLATNGTAIHWHGVRQMGTNEQDGVPGVTECALAPGQSKTYTWHASSYGTSWYHSHWGVQYGEGVRGPIVIHGPATSDYDVDAGPMFLSEIFNNTAFQENWLISHIGPLNPANYLVNGHNTVNDLSSGQHSLWQVQKGKKYLFRIINGGTQNQYSLSFDSHTMTVIAADFVPIVPYQTQWLNIGVGQRYDVVVEMDQDVDSYFFRAVTQTTCPSATDNDGLGQANAIIQYQGAPDTLPPSRINGAKTPRDFAQCLDEPLASLVPFLPMKGSSDGTSAEYTSGVKTVDGGQVTKAFYPDNGLVFQWFLNDSPLYVNYTQPTLKSISEGIAVSGNSSAASGNSTTKSVYANNIVLEKANSWYYFVIQNKFFASHPMHLHGHDFAILGQGYGQFNGDSSTFNFVNPMRRDTVMLVGLNPANVAGGQQPAPNDAGYTVIGFQSDNPGAWLMHCHIAWHVDGGLALQWIERPEEIVSANPGINSIDGECSAYEAYQQSYPAGQLEGGSSGLRKRSDSPLFFDRQVAEINARGGIVRRNAAANYISRRAVGDGSARHFGRRFSRK